MVDDVGGRAALVGDAVTGFGAEDEYAFVPAQAGRSRGDYALFPPGDSSLRPPKTPKWRLRDPLDDFAGDIIGDELLPT